MFQLPHRAVPRTSCRGQKGIPTTYPVSPQQLPKVQFVAELAQPQRPRLSPPFRPLQPSRRGDRSTILLPPPQRTSTLLAPMWPFGRLAFLELPSSVVEHAPTKHCLLICQPRRSFPSFSLETPPTCISATHANPCTPPRHQNWPPKELRAASEGVSAALTGPAGSLAALWLLCC